LVFFFYSNHSYNLFYSPNHFFYFHNGCNYLIYYNFIVFKISKFIFNFIKFFHLGRNIYIKIKIMYLNLKINKNVCLHKSFFLFYSNNSYNLGSGLQAFIAFCFFELISNILNKLLLTSFPNVFSFLHIFAELWLVPLTKS